MAQGSSFGYGLALQDKWPQQNYGRDSWMAGQRQKKVKAAGDEKDAAAYQKYLESIKIDPNKIHRWDVAEARETYAKGLEQIEQAQLQHPNTWKNKAAQIASETEWKVQELYNRKPKLDADDAAIRKYQEQGSSTMGQDALSESLRTGMPGDFQQDPFETATVVKNKEGRYETNVLAVPKVDFQKEVIGRIGKNPAYQAQVSWYQANMDNMPSDVKAYVMRYGMPRNPDDARKLETKMKLESGTLVSTKDIITDMVEDPMYFKAAEQNVRDEITKEQEKYFKTLDMDGRREYVSNKLMDKYHEYGGAKYDLKMVRERVPPRPTQADKDKQWQSEGTTFSNAKNSITVSHIGQTDIPKLVGMPQLSNNPNLKVYTFSHKDVMENKPLILTDGKGRPQNGIFKGVIMDDKKPEDAMMVVAVNSEDSPTGLQYMTMPNTPANRDVIKNEYGKTAEEALQALGGKTGTTSDGGEVKSKRSGSSSSGKSEKTVSKRQYSASRNQTKIIYSDGTEEIIEGK